MRSLTLLIVLATYATFADVDVGRARAERTEKVERLLREYRARVTKITLLEKQAKEDHAAQCEVVDGLTLTSETLRASAHRYIAEELQGRLRDLRAAAAMAGEDFSAGVEQVTQKYDRILGRNRRMSYERSELPESRADRALETYRGRVAQFLSPAVLGDEAKVKFEKLTTDDIIKVNGNTYLPYFLWGGGRMNDNQFISKALVEYVEFLNGATTASFTMSAEKEVFFRERTFELIPSILKDKLYVSLKDNDPEGYKLWKSKIDQALEMRLLRHRIDRLKRTIAVSGSAPTLRVPTPDLFAKDVSPSAPDPVDILRVEDRFGRDITEEGIRLIDWDGYIANPAIKLVLRANPQRPRDLRVSLISSNARLHFNNPCALSRDSATKEIRFGPGKNAEEVYVTIWPDRDGQSEEHEIEVFYWYDEGPGTSPKKRVFRITAYVQDLDSGEDAGASQIITAVPSWPYLASPPNAPFLSPPFPYLNKDFSVASSERFMINLDFSFDKSRFFSDDENGGADRRAVFKQAADDWAYFILASIGKTSTGSDAIALSTGAENETKEDAIATSNRYSFKDFLVYVSGVPGTFEPAARAGRLLKESQSGGKQERGVVKSGQVLVSGVERPDKFVVDKAGSQWWALSWDEKQPVDLYSYAVHEIGHAIAFSRAHQLFRSWYENQRVDVDSVTVYQGHRPLLNEGGHLHKEIDVESRRGGFGVIDGDMPAQQWLITKLDLLMLAAAGYGLKPNELWGQLSYSTQFKSELRLGEHVEMSVTAKHGIEPYFWIVEAGELPRGLVLNSFTGKISGNPSEIGEYHFILSIRDSSNTDTLPLYHYQMIRVH